eukprot:CAMPEP_0202969982 /NCGR_PEP_ID=MMETSP1396-20130829/15909_1 /ASSEMBLY_ACC=CAM_ASM_000872 /TAXON_ID= /ORGANISM="Pseudokeronopsis sp., Strain Brazil" /LENGTH=64 /DNA_ID=CAMNT_0049698127 /DNA_START=1 /DNA_END=191 /DNA_ORIENTATION=-
MGQIAIWDFEEERYRLNEGVVDYVFQAVGTDSLEVVAKYIFFQLAEAIFHLHEEAHVIHRDIKP